MKYFNQQTERLIFRKLTREDIPDWMDFFDNNPNLIYMGIDLSKGKEALATDWILIQLERYKLQGLGHLAVIEKSSNKLLGIGGIIPRDLDGKPILEIAYSLKPKYWGKGYGSEVANQLREFGFENKLSSRFVSLIHKENVRSINVAKKNQMKICGETIFMGMDVFIYCVEK